MTEIVESGIRHSIANGEDEQDSEKDVIAVAKLEQRRHAWDARSREESIRMFDEEKHHGDRHRYLGLCCGRTFRISTAFALSDSINAGGNLSMFSSLGAFCYDFIRFVTYPPFSRCPWPTQNALNFVQGFLESTSFAILSAIDRDTRVLSQTLSEYPQLRSSIMHDIHTAVLMREHGISRICTRDADFHRFSFLTVVDSFRQ